MSEETSEMTAPKIILFIAMLFMLAEAVAYFTAGGIEILYGILELVFIAVIFISLALVSLGPIKIPYYWWIMLIIGVLLILFASLAGGTYLTGILVLLAVIVELVTEKKDFKASKLMALVGIAFSIWDCIAIFIGFTAGNEILIVNAVFGLILAIILLILVLDLVDIKIPYTWWVVLTIAFVIWTWVSPFAAGLIVTGFGGTILMIAWILILFAF
ncbi:MAG: hypothetical protein KAT57_07305 [Candidatus Lokiarchaeota archaeon]|nr:hypothetical protein [Candidatus Lokiarchaeota archaeon]